MANEIVPYEEETKNIEIDSGGLDDDQIVSFIQTEMNNAIGGTGSSDSGSDSELTAAWEKALDYYFGKPRGDEVDGRSKVISMDLADMVEQTVAQMMPSFKTDSLVSFNAYNNKETEQAAVESDAVNWAIMDDNHGFIEITNAVKDALLQRNGIMKIYVDERTTIDEEEFENMPISRISEIFEIPDIEIIEAMETNPGEFDQFDQMISEPTYYVKLRKTIKVKQLKIESIPPDEFCVNGDHGSIFLEDCRFACHTTYPTRSDLVARGYDKDEVDKLPPMTSKTNSDTRARSRDQQENEMDAAQRASDRIETKECYYQLDVDGDGIAERRRIVKAGNKIFENEIYPTVPFAAGTCFLLPHRFWCLSMHDKMKQTVDTKTAFLRKTIDNAEGLINQRSIVVPGRVNMSDVLSSRPTGVVRAKSTDAIAPYPVQNMGDTGFKMLNYMDKIRKEGGGSQLDVGTQENLPVQGQTAHGMERWMSSQEQLPFMMTNTIAYTLVHETFRIAHLLMRRFMPETMTYESKGQMVSTTPGTWPPRPRLKINVQLSMTERQRKYNVLTEIIHEQKEMMAAGLNGIMAGPKNSYYAMIDKARYAGFDNPERYYIDPTSEEAQKAAKSNQQQAMMTKKEQEQAQDKLLQTQVHITELQESSDKMKAMLDNAIKSNEQLRKWVEMTLESEKDMREQASNVRSLANG